LGKNEYKNPRRLNKLNIAKAKKLLMPEPSRIFISKVFNKDIFPFSTFCSIKIFLGSPFNLSP